MGVCPCKNCEARCEACHGKCEEYLAWKKVKDEFNHKRATHDMIAHTCAGLELQRKNSMRNKRLI